jgi:mannose-1-phosphate guanylyltransferase
MYPKQFLPLASKHSMLQETAQRVRELSAEETLFLCNENHRFLVAEQLRAIEYPGSQILLEPVGRNTAPALALAALDILEQNDDAVMLVMAADHVIKDQKAFYQAIADGVDLAEQGYLATFGIVPTFAATGYGYIRKGEPIQECGFLVSSFVEKPDPGTAQSYVAGGDHLWNSGMFVFRASDYLAELEIHAPAILAACKEAYAVRQTDLDFIRVGKDAFAACPEDSIDYAVMEKTDKSVVVPLNAGWNDIGSWAALWDVHKKDDQNNAFRGDVIMEDTRNCLVHSSHKLVATVGLENVVVVETKDAVLVAGKEHVQEVKKIVDALKKQDRQEYLFHREVYRPWGKYDSIDMGNRYQAKRITVKPGAKLSVQKHHHRAEHWVVVSGTAKVTNGDKTFLVTENESTYIPVGEVHALENPGRIDLELIEIQSGSYLGEDDIVRFEDRYGRTK